MNLLFSNSCLGYRIVSLALDESVRDDLLQDGLDVLFVNQDSISILPCNVVLSIESEKINELQTCNNFDVFELTPQGLLRQLYDNSSNDNSFFVTPKCNSNCVMCPSPDSSRRQPHCTDASKLIEIAKHIPVTTKHLTITGGEPFMLGMQMFHFLAFLKTKYYETEFLILTNGRIFAIDKYALSLKENIPNNTILAIPLHGSSPSGHDSITRAYDSFSQTVKGLKNLLRLGIRIELRLVVTKLNADDFLAMSDLIAEELSQVEYVCIMAAEMTGNARKNIEKVWLPYSEAFRKIAPAIMNLVKKGINVRLYNFPLCTVEEEYIALCEKSISPEKVRFAECCADCTLRDACGGVFAGTYLLERNDLQPIL